MWTPSALASETRRLRGDVWRVVEAQHEVATRRITGSAAEQAVLEDILEETKPPYPEECSRLDYLLKTPFRYPPASPYGSRFRRANTRDGVFYGAESIRTALAEVAFYRLLFFEAMAVPVYPREATALTAFTASYATDAGLDLTRPPLDRDRSAWVDPVDYTATQALAEQARLAGIQAIRYESARDPDAGTNVALLTCAAFARTTPRRRQTWLLLVRQAEVAVWRSAAPQEAHTFARSLFAHDGKLLAPGA